jgi:hypothetical protein
LGLLVGHIFATLRGSSGFSDLQEPSGFFRLNPEEPPRITSLAMFEKLENLFSKRVL